MTAENPLQDLSALRAPLHVMARGQLADKLKVKHFAELDRDLDKIMEAPAEALYEELAKDDIDLS